MSGVGLFLVACLSESGAEFCLSVWSGTRSVCHYRLCLSVMYLSVNTNNNNSLSWSKFVWVILQLVATGGGDRTSWVSHGYETNQSKVIYSNQESVSLTSLLDLERCPREVLHFLSEWVTPFLIVFSTVRSTWFTDNNLLHKITNKQTNSYLVWELLARYSILFSQIGTNGNWIRFHRYRSSIGNHYSWLNIKPDKHLQLSTQVWVDYHVHIYTFSHLLSLYSPIDKGEETYGVVFCV